MIGAKICLSSSGRREQPECEAGEPDVDAEPQHLVGERHAIGVEAARQHPEHDVGHHSDEHGVIEREQQTFLRIGERVEVDTSRMIHETSTVSRTR